jgi:hypothetical protein
VFVTEKDALKKDCVANRTVNCWASQCMAWRWAVGEMQIVGPYDLPPDDEAWVLESKLFHMWSRPWGEMRTGYCGLAGKPDK